MNTGEEPVQRKEGMPGVQRILPSKIPSVLSEEEIDSSIPTRLATKYGRDCDEEIDQLRKDIRSLRETMRNYMAEKVRP